MQLKNLVKAPSYYALKTAKVKAEIRENKGNRENYLKFLASNPK